jgi:hypothetical protein
MKTLLKNVFKNCHEKQKKIVNLIYVKSTCFPTLRSVHLSIIYQGCLSCLRNTQEVYLWEILSISDTPYWPVVFITKACRVVLRHP